MGTIKIVAAILLFASLAEPQEPVRQNHGQGYLFFAPGRVCGATSASIGGGAEANLHRGFGFGVEIAYFTPLAAFSQGIGLLSANAQYTFGLDAPAKVKPFLTGGYSLAFRDGAASAMNLGGGIHYWFRPRTGLRLELRDYIVPFERYSHAWQARVGIELR